MTKPLAIGIGGSPRIGGNTDILLDRALEGAAEAGAEVRKIRLNNLKIKPCQHCDGCKESGECVIIDDMTDLYISLRKADVCILASPVFFLGVTAQTKVFIYRCQPFCILREKRKINLPQLSSSNRKNGLFICVAGSDLPNVCQCAISCAKIFFKVCNYNFLGSLTYTGFDEYAAIIKNRIALEEAFESGKKAVLSL